MHSTPEARRLAARIAAETSWAMTEDRSARTAAARRAAEERFLTQADGDPVRAEHLRKAHYARLSLKSLEARRKSKLLAEQAAAAEAELAELEDDVALRRAE